MSGSSSGFSYGPVVPEDLRLLCMLHNIGATTPERSLTVKEISEWTTVETSIVQSYLQKFVEQGYVNHIRAGEIDKYHLTLNGIRKVLSIYS
jgi:DNA-binding IclR family transcriptional regulator